MEEEDAVKLKEWTVQLVKNQFELQQKTLQVFVCVFLCVCAMCMCVCLRAYNYQAVYSSCHQSYHRKGQFHGGL